MPAPLHRPSPADPASAILPAAPWRRFRGHRRALVLGLIVLLGGCRGASGPSAGPVSLTPEILTELIRQKPANVGTALRDWVAATKRN